ncbi:transglycosylase SLT domain-containing protein [Ghiorsea bivora]|uniref:transglycosylase SLT domain-containing protein n=1 Tax=Ghiorsea bivora TaxID=1485545 RepID=UPI00056F5A44|nr:transglycosylase SLT domain-containing protein [Ghiorsea bivora]
MSWLKYSLLLLLLVGSIGCAKKPPSNLDNSCSIFKEKSSWYDDANDSFKKWGVPIHVQLAIIHQESRFRAQAKSPKDYLLWFIPWGRKSSAYGYAQVKDATWDWYKEKTGNWHASRDDFADVTDFIGWYGNYTYKTLGVSKWDAYKQYLAYHEGHGGFKRKTYLKKPWLIKVARKVKKRASMYHSQLQRCKDQLGSSSFWPF